MCSNIRVDMKGSELVRILPRRNDLINQDWITDLSRYSFDGLKNQRFSYPMHYTKSNGVFLVSTWDKFYCSFASLYTSLLTSSSRTLFNIGSSLDLYSLYLLQLLNKNVVNSSLKYVNSSNHISFDFRSSYLVDSLDSLFGKSDLVFISELDLSSCFPLLATRVRKSINSKHPTSFFYSGLSPSMVSDYTHFSLSRDAMCAVLRGKSFFSSSFSFSKKASLLSSGTFCSSFVSKLNSLHNITASIIHSDTSILNACELGIATGGNCNTSSSFYYGLNVSSIPNLNELSSAVLHSTHSEMNLSLIKSSSSLHHLWYLPSYSSFESEAPYLNLVGLIQWTRKCTSPFGDARSYDDVLRRILILMSVVSSSISGVAVQSFFDRVPNLLSSYSNISSFFLNTTNFNFVSLSVRKSSSSSSFVPFSSTVASIGLKSKLRKSIFY